MMELRGIEAYSGAHAYKNESGSRTDEREFENILTGETLNTHDTKNSDSKENKYEQELFTVTSSVETITYDFFGKVSRYSKQAGINLDISV